MIIPSTNIVVQALDAAGAGSTNPAHMRYAMQDQNLWGRGSERLSPFETTFTVRSLVASASMLHQPDIDDDGSDDGGDDGAR